MAVEALRICRIDVLNSTVSRKCGDGNERDGVQQHIRAPWVQPFTCPARAAAQARKQAGPGGLAPLRIVSQLEVKAG